MIARIKKLIALVLATVLGVGSLSTFASMSAFAADPTGTDITNSNQIAGSYLNLQYNTKDNANYEPMVTKNEGGTVVYTVPDGVSPRSLKQVSVQYRFTLVDSTKRTVKEGDFIRLKFPEWLKVESKEGKLTFNADGETHTLADYTVDPATNELLIVLNDNVAKEHEFEDLVGSAGFNFNVDLDSLSSDHDNKAELPGVSGTPASLVIPQVPSDFNGVKKSGTLDKETNSANWTISVGTDPQSAGMSLAGVTIREAFDTSLMTLSDDGSDVQFVDTGAKDASGKSIFEYTFPDDSTLIAPATIRVRTMLTRKAILAAAGQDDYNVENDASISDVPDTYDHNPDDPVAKAEVPVLATTAGKEGKQVDANTMRWTITVNPSKAKSYKATVSDKLSEILHVKAGSDVRILNENGGFIANAVKVDNEAAIPDTGAYYYWIETDASGKETIRIKFNQPFSDTYRIEFDTTVAPQDADSTESRKIKNTADISAEFPTGNGPGTMEWSTPEVDMPVDDVVIEKSGVSADERTGHLTWTLKPTTQSPDWTKITVTDILEGSQKHQDGVGPVVKAGNTTLDPDTDYTYTYNPATKEEKWEFNRDALDAKGIDINDIEITYVTTAVDYFKTNRGTYYRDGSNTRAKVVVQSPRGNSTAVDDAELYLENMLISKSMKVEFDRDNDIPYFHFTVPLNGKNNIWTNATFNDDVTNSLFATTDGSTACRVSGTSCAGATKLDPRYFRVVAADPSLDTAPSYASYVEDSSGYSKELTSKLNAINTDTKRSLEADFGDLDKAITVHVYVALTEEGRNLLNGESDNADNLWGDNIVAYNKAIIDADQFEAEPGNLYATTRSTGPTTAVTNKGVKKSGAQAQNGALNWNIDVNPTGAHMGGTTITDTIPKGLLLDKESVKVYSAQHNPNGGTEITGTVGDPLPLDDFNFTAAKQKNGTTVLSFTLPKDSTESYRIVYSTEIITRTADNRYSNSVTADTGRNKENASSTIAAANSDSASGATRVMLEFTKVDALSEKDHLIPVAGAHYGLFADPEATDLVDDAYSDETGKVSLAGRSGRTYYIQEIDADETSSASDTGTYKRDETIYGPYTQPRRGTYTIAPVCTVTELNSCDNASQGNNFIDYRELDSLGTVNITKVFDGHADGQSTTDKTAKYELYLYPAGSGSTLKKPVKINLQENGTAGEYVYSAAEDSSGGAATQIDTAAAVAKDDTSLTSDASGTLRIGELPHGEYGLIEVKGPDGFVTDSETKFFRVSRSTDGSQDAAITYGEGFAAEDDGTIKQENLQTSVTITMDPLESTKDDTEYTMTPEDGKTFADGSTSIKLTGKELREGKKLVGVLKEGDTYTITENDTPAGYLPTKPVTFTVADKKGTVTMNETPDGEIKQNYVPQEDDIKQPAVINLKHTKTSFTVTVKDQNKVPVEGATVTVTPAPGSTFADGSTEPKTFTSGKDPNPIEGLLTRNGTYYVTEDNDKATSPGGLVSSDIGKPVIVKVSDDGTKLSVVDEGSEQQYTEYSGDPYMHGETAKDAKISDSEKDLILWNHTVLLAHFEVIKTDATSGELVPGSSFTLYMQKGDAPDPDTDLKIATLEDGKENRDPNADGIIRSTDYDPENQSYGDMYLSHGLTQGKYYLVEETVPYNYTAAEDSSNSTGKKLYTFAVSADDDQKIIMVGDDGDTAASHMTIDEARKMREAYQAASDKASNAQKINRLSNKRVLGTLKVTKTKGSGTAPLKGVTYQLYTGKEDPDTGDMTYTKVDADSATQTYDGDEEDAHLTFPDIDWNVRYFIKEVKAPKGYTIDPVYHEVPEMTRDTPNLTESITLSDETTSMSISKRGVDADGNTVDNLQGAIFTISGVFADGSAEKTMSADDLADAPNTLKNQLIVGNTYTVTETTVPENYGAVEPFTFTVTEDGQDSGKLVLGDDVAKNDLGDPEAALSDDGTNTITVTNRPTVLYWSVAVKTFNGSDDGTLGRVPESDNLTTDKDPDTARLRKVRYAIFDSEDKANDPNATPLREVESDDDGNIRVLGLPRGRYYIRAISTPSTNVILSTDVYTADVTGTSFEGVRDDSGELVENNVLKHSVYRGVITFKKVDKENHEKMVAGATYGLYQLSTLKASDLAGGSTKDNGPAGMPEDGQAIPTQEGAANDVPESDKEITFKSQEWTLIDTQVSGDNGSVTFEHVVSGQNYLVKEIVEAKGYQLSKTPLQVELTRDASSATPEKVTQHSTLEGNPTVTALDDGTLLWQEPRVKVLITKVDESGKPLAGARLQLKDDKGHIVKTASGDDSWVSSDKAGKSGKTTSQSIGELFSGVLEAGKTYTIVELDAPQGYKINSKGVTFTVKKMTLTDEEASAQSAVQKVTFKNKLAPVPAIPQPTPGTKQGGKSQKHTDVNQPASKNPLSSLAKTGVSVETLIAATVFIMVLAVLALTAGRIRGPQSSQQGAHIARRKR